MGRFLAHDLALESVAGENQSQLTASVAEDISVLGSIWLMFNHPVIMMILVAE